MSPELKQTPTPETQSLLARRDLVARELLGIDYDYAKSRGLLDMFYCDPVIGEDGFLHVFAGMAYSNQEGGVIPAGFHHEPSSASEDTYVDREHLQHGTSRDRKEHVERLYESFTAKTIIQGFEKGPTSSMFPNQYDALTVLEAIKQAKESAPPPEKTSAGLLVSQGEATMIDGQSKMRIRLILDSTGEKIVSAFPVSSQRLKLGKRALDGTLQNVDKEKLHSHLGL